MKTLNLFESHTSFVALASPIALCALCLSAVPLRAQEAPGRTETPATLAGQAAQPAPSIPAPAAQSIDAPTINFRERPTYTTDPQRLRRTPTLDGVLADGEWDAFYSVTQGPIKGTVYCNWDDNYLYLAARTDQPALLVVDVDASDDGWLRSADNLELAVGSTGDNTAPSLAARLLDAANSKDAPFWSTQSLDTKSILMAGKTTNGTQVIELGIPKSLGSLVLRPGANIGLRVEFLPPGPAVSYKPTAPYEPHLLLDATLVESRAQPAVGITPRLTLSDSKCVAGQKLFGTFDLHNQTDVPVPVRSVQWVGQGGAASVLDTFRQVAVPVIPPGKSIRLKYKSVLPQNVIPGSYALTVTAELADGRQTQSTATVTVVEPIQPQLSTDPDPVTVVGTTKLDLVVSIYSAVPDHFRGELELTKFPDTWQLDGAKRRSVVVYGKDKSAATHLIFKLPASTAAGDYPVEARITWYGRTWDLRRIVHVQTTKK